MRYNAIVAINHHGVVAYSIYEGSTNKERYLDFLRNLLVPAMQPYPGRNCIVVHDNASFHRGPEVRNVIENAGGALLALPAYSPDFNPIELLFGWAKKWLRRHRDVQEAEPDLCLVRALAQCPPEHFAAWVLTLATHLVVKMNSRIY